MTKNAYNYVEITNDGLVAGVGPLIERMNFWDDLYAKYANSFDSYYFRIKPNEKDEL